MGKDNNWKNVWHNWSGEKADQWNIANFTPVNASSIRINFKSNDASCGIIEWRVWGKQSKSAEYIYQYADIENHVFGDYMRYAPLPYRETLVMENLKQNDGWK